MKRTAKGCLPLDFATLRSHYPTYNRLPPHIAKYMADLNKGIPEGKPKNTPCCFQVSEALNLSGAEHAIPPRSWRRANSHLGMNYYLGAVDELEIHLTSRYGKGEGLHLTAGSGTDRTKKMKAAIAGRQGILCFRDQGYGAHTELWDGTDIVQNGAPAANGAALSGGYIWGQPHIWFWQATGEDDVDPLPAWLTGWWDVNDGQQYYYYVSDQGVVVWTQTEPKSANEIPIRKIGNEGAGVFDPAGTFIITWDQNGDSSTVETFRWAVQPSTTMAGTSNRFGPLVAQRKTTWKK